MSKLPRTGDGQVHLRDILRGVVRGLPDTVGTLRGLRTLLRVRFGTQPSVGAVLEALAEQQPGAPALLFEERRWTLAGRVMKPAANAQGNVEILLYARSREVWASQTPMSDEALSRDSAA